MYFIVYMFPLGYSHSVSQRPPPAPQKAVFYGVKGHLLQGKRPPFTSRGATRSQSAAYGYGRKVRPNTK